MDGTREEISSRIRETGRGVEALTTTETIRRVGASEITDL